MLRRMDRVFELASLLVMVLIGLLAPAPARAQRDTGPAMPQPPAGWALVRYGLPSTVPLEPASVIVVSASSEAMALYAQADSAKRENQAMADRMATDSLDTATAPLGSRTSFIVVPSRPCERLRSTLAARTLPDEHPDRPESVYFHATTDGNGHIASMRVLYTDASEQATQRLVAFGKENLRAWSPEKPKLALELYGSLQVRENGNVSAGTLAGSSLF